MSKCKVFKALCIAAVGFSAGVIAKTWIDISEYGRNNSENDEETDEYKTFSEGKIYIDDGINIGDEPFPFFETETD